MSTAPTATATATATAVATPVYSALPLPVVPVPGFVASAPFDSLSTAQGELLAPDHQHATSLAGVYRYVPYFAPRATRENEIQGLPAQWQQPMQLMQQQQQQEMQLMHHHQPMQLVQQQQPMHSIHLDAVPHVHLDPVPHVRDILRELYCMAHSRTGKTTSRTCRKAIDTALGKCHEIIDRARAQKVQKMLEKTRERIAETSCSKALAYFSNQEAILEDYFLPASSDDSSDTDSGSEWLEDDEGDEDLEPALSEPQERPSESDTCQVRETFAQLEAPGTNGEPSLLSRCRFQVVPFMRELQARLSNGRTDEMMAGGQTQSRKTMFKVVTVLLAKKCQVATFLVTTFVSGRNSLTAKMKEYLGQLPSGNNVPELHMVTGNLKGEVKLSEHDKKRKVQAFDTFTLSDTASQFDKARSLLDQARCSRWIMIIDEADAMHRTEGGDLKLEKALKRLLEPDDEESFPPLVTLNVSATLIPIMLRWLQLREGGSVATAGDPHIFGIQAGTDYMGLDDMRCLEHPQTGRPWFAEPGDLTNKNMYGLEVADGPVRAMLVDAASKPKSLLLDITCPRVTGDHSIEVKAEMAQGIVRDDPNCEHGLAVITYSASAIGIKYSFSHEWEYFNIKKDKIGIEEALKIVDDKVGQRPVMIVGYSQMIRGTSFRTEKRVPTHIIGVLGAAQSMDRVLQMFGRGQGEFRAQLRRNGFEHVTLLTTGSDYDTCKSYLAFQAEVMRLMGEGKSLKHALDGGVAKLGANFVHCTTHPVGPKKLNLSCVAESACRNTPGCDGIGMQTVKADLRDKADAGDEDAILQCHLMDRHAGQKRTVDDMAEDIKAHPPTVSPGNPRFPIRKRVGALWYADEEDVAGRFHPGRIGGFDPENQTYTVEFDDGDRQPNTREGDIRDPSEVRRDQWAPAVDQDHDAHMAFGFGAGGDSSPDADAAAMPSPIKVPKTKVTKAANSLHKLGVAPKKSKGNDGKAVHHFSSQ